MGGVEFSRVESSIGSDFFGEEAPLSDGPGPSRTDEEIQIVFDRYKSALYRIYNRQLRKNPTLQGKMVLRLTIKPDGKSINHINIRGKILDYESKTELPFANISVKGKSILIFRGSGGREKLAETLRSRGAKVDYIECYERTRPQNDANILSELWDRNSLHGIILTSVEGLKNLYQMVNKRDLPRLNNTLLYVISSTMVELCGKLGYKLTPVLLPSAHDEDVLESVTNFYTAKKP